MKKFVRGTVGIVATGLLSAGCSSSTDKTVEYEPKTCAPFEDEASIDNFVVVNVTADETEETHFERISRRLPGAAEYIIAYAFCDVGAQPYSLEGLLETDPLDYKAPRVVVEGSLSDGTEVAPTNCVISGLAGEMTDSSNIDNFKPMFIDEQQVVQVVCSLNSGK